MAKPRMQQTIQRWHCMPESVDGSICNHECIYSTDTISLVQQVNGGPNYENPKAEPTNNQRQEAGSSREARLELS